MPQIGHTVPTIDKLGKPTPVIVEKAIAKLPGVAGISVNLATERADVTFAGVADPQAVVQATQRAGYEARRVEGDSASSDQAASARKQELHSLRRSLLLAAVLALPVFILEMGSHLIPAVHDFVMTRIGKQTSWLIQFALTSLVLFGPGLRFFQKGIPAILRGTPDMNSLVTLGTGAAWGYSLVATIAPGVLPPGTANVYYEAAAVIVALILLGRYLETKAKGWTSEAIKRLVGLQAKTARVVRDGAALEVALADVRAGDIVQVRPGERVPVDGEVVDGSSYVDESMITCEPVQVAKAAGAAVVDGTINKTGAFTFRATKVGADTVLAQIIRMVEQAQGSKLPIQAMVDKVTAWFVPAVTGIAGLTFLVWYAIGPEPALTFALVNAVAVLIIAWPIIATATTAPTAQSSKDWRMTTAVSRIWNRANRSVSANPAVHLRSGLSTRKRGLVGSRGLQIGLKSTEEQACNGRSAADVSEGLGRRRSCSPIAPEIA